MHQCEGLHRRGYPDTLVLRGPNNIVGKSDAKSPLSAFLKTIRTVINTYTGPMRVGAFTVSEGTERMLRCFGR